MGVRRLLAALVVALLPALLPAAELTHFVKMDNTQRTTTSTTAVEVTQYTIAWADLTGAGFAASDDVILLIATKLDNVSAAQYTRFQVGHGTTYAGRTDWSESLTSVEAAPPAASHQYNFIERHTLVTSENLYFSLWTSSNTNAARTDEFSCAILELGGLTSNDFFYAETTPSGDAPTTYTDGAIPTAPSTGDYVMWATTHWLDDSTTADARMKFDINNGTQSMSIREVQGEDTENSWSVGIVAYRALTAGWEVAVQYQVGTAATHDCNSTKVFGLKLGAFQDYAGVQSVNTVTHTALDTYQEFAGFPSYSKTTTGNVIAVALPYHTSNEGTKAPYGRIQLANADWDITDRNRGPVKDNGGAQTGLGPYLFGYASVTSGTLDWDFDVAEEVDVSPNYSCDEQVAVVFSLELAGGAPPPCTPTLTLLGVGKCGD